MCKPFFLESHPPPLPFSRIYLSLCSKKCKRVISQFKINVPCIRWKLSYQETVVSFGEKFSIIIDVCPPAGYRMFFDRNPSCARRTIHGNWTVMYHQSFSQITGDFDGESDAEPEYIECVKLWIHCDYNALMRKVSWPIIEFVMTVFNSANTKLFTELIPNEDLNRFLNSSNTHFECLILKFKDESQCHLTESNLMDILENVTISELQIHSSPSQKSVLFKSTLPLKMNVLRLYDPFWLTLESVMSMHGAILWAPSAVFDARELKIIVEKWIGGAFENLEVLSLGFTGSKDCFEPIHQTWGESILKNGRPSNHGGLLLSEGRDIRRTDGMLSSVLFDNSKFLFVVWKPQYMNGNFQIVEY